MGKRIFATAAKRRIAFRDLGVGKGRPQFGGGNSIPYISTCIVAPVPAIIADHGGKVDRPFREAGVPIELASQAERILPLRDYFTLLEAAAHETGDEHFGLSLGQTFSFEKDLGPFGALISGARTLRQAIETTNSIIRYFSSASNCWLEVKGQRAHWVYKMNDARNFNEGRRLDCEGALIAFRSVIRMATRPNWQPNKVLLEPTLPHQVRALQSRFGVEAQCGGAYALVFSRDLLDFPMTCGKPLGAAERRALVLRLISSAPEQTFTDSVKAIIRARLCGGYPEMNAVARSTELSPRTFQRTLAKEGLTYSDLVTDVRSEIAHELLADPSRSQLDISLSLGYSDAANFSRAFKNQIGMTPREYRKTICGSHPSKYRVPDRRSDSRRA